MYCIIPLVLGFIAGRNCGPRGRCSCGPVGRCCPPPPPKCCPPPPPRGHCHGRLY